MKPILSFKIEQGKYSRDETNYFQKYVEEKFGEEYDIIFTPFEMTNPTNDAVFFSINGIGYTYEEITSALQPQKRGQRAMMNIFDEKILYTFEGLKVDSNRDSFKKYPPINI